MTADLCLRTTGGRRPPLQQGDTVPLRNALPSIGQVMRSGGFDCVIGNPPYIRIQAMKEWAPVEVEFYKQHYKAASSGNYDIYVVFIEKGLGLLNQKGKLGFICPHKFFNAQYGEPLRKLVSGEKNLSRVIHFGDQQVFEGVTTYTCLLFLARAGSKQLNIEKVTDLEAWRATGQAIQGNIPAAKITATQWNFAIGQGGNLFDRLSKMQFKLGDISEIFVGLQTSADTVFLFKECQRGRQQTTRVYSKELNRPVILESALLKPVIRSGEIGRYWAEPTALVLFPYRITDRKAFLIPEKQMKDEHPKAWDYLSANKALLSSREHEKFKSSGWYQLYPKNLERWEQPKIMLPYMITRLAACYDDADNYFVNVTTGGFGVVTDEARGSMKYVTGVLNSALLDWYLRQVTTSFHGGYFAANKQYIEQLPIRPINFPDVADKARHDEMVKLVDRMLELNKQKHSAKLAPSQVERVDREIAATDGEIDNLVYDLYAITDEERKVIEAP